MQATQLRVDISLADPDIRRTERHQFVNLIHVIHAELQLIERISGRIGTFRHGIRLCEAAIQAFGERNAAVGYRDELIDFQSQIVSQLAGFMAEDIDDQDASDIDDARRVLLELIDAADVRVQEILARHEIDRPWATFEAEKIPGTDRSSVGGTAIRAPTGLGAAIRRFVSDIEHRPCVSVGIDTTPGGSSVVSVATPGVPLPGFEFTENTRIDYELLRSDPDQATKLAVLGIYFIVLRHGGVSYSTTDSPNDTLLVTVNPVA